MTTTQAAERPPLSGWTLILATFSLSLGVFMNVLDAAIANVSIPSIAGNLGVSNDQGTWVITSFAVSQAVMLPITGWLAKRFGEIRLFLFSTLMFTITSLFCGMAFDFGMLVFFRALQGAVSGPMIPLSQSILLSIYPSERRAFATAFWSMIAVLGPVCGPTLGGWLTDNYSWPWIFYINLPVGLFSVFVTGLILLNRETKISRPPIDGVGLAFLIIGISALQILLDNGHKLDWFQSDVICTLGIVSLIALSCLLVWEITAKHPIIDLTLFKKRNFTIGTLALSLGYLVYFANVVIYPLWLQSQMGYTPTWAGLAVAPVGILPIIATPIVAIFLNKIDLRVFASIGFLIFGSTAFWMTTFDTTVDYPLLFTSRLIQGLGVSFFFTPLISIIVSGLPQERLASALGLANFFRILGGSFGTSLSVDTWYRRESFHQARLVEHINPFNATSQHIVTHLKAIGFSVQQSYAVIQESVINQAFMMATNDIYWLSGVLFFGLLIVVWFTKPPFISGTVVAES